MIAILTDFGPSEYVGVMKGVIYRHCPDAVVVDLFNDIRPQDVRQAAWVLLQTHRHFPAGTVFLCVVDPGVGMDRQALGVQTTAYTFVAPDNGLLAPTLRGIGSVKACVALPVPDQAANTFHGRDVLAPAAAALAGGSSPQQLGPPTHLAVDLHFHRHGREGEIVHIDRFGNIITNLPPLAVGRYRVRSGAYDAVLDGVNTYADAAGTRPVVVAGSSGTLEIAVRDGSAASRLKLGPGSKIEITAIDAKT